MAKEIIPEDFSTMSKLCANMKKRTPEDENEIIKYRQHEYVYGYDVQSRLKEKINQYIMKNMEYVNQYISDFQEAIENGK